MFFVEEEPVIEEALLIEDEPALVVSATVVSEPTVLGDIDGDGEVGFTDFLEFSRSFGADAEFNASADFDRDGAVDFPDFLIFTREFGDYESRSVVSPEPTLPVWWLCAVATCCVRSSKRRGSSRRET